MTLSVLRPLAALLVLVAVAANACGGPGPEPAYRGFTEHYIVRITSDPVPPRARERTLFKIVVRDKDSDQPIEGGQGIIYAETRDGAKTWDGFEPGPELGTYYATLKFVVAGDWAMGLRFRRDSTQKLEQVDWMQEVRAERSGTP
jgi:hypothetical protein